VTLIWDYAVSTALIEKALVLTLSKSWVVSSFIFHVASYFVDDIHTAEMEK